jgi:hypothetical protein
MVTLVLLVSTNTTIVNWLLAIFVGNYGIWEGYERAVRNFSITGYFLTTAFRSFPFVLLLRYSLKSDINKMPEIKWFVLIVITYFIAWGYWDTLHTLYTPERTSSTAALAYVFIPIFAIGIGIVAGVIGYVLGKSIRFIQSNKHQNINE